MDRARRPRSALDSDGADWRLNERHYGALQGLNKAETAARHGEEQTLIWRRSYDIPPPRSRSMTPASVERSAVRRPVARRAPLLRVPQGHGRPVLAVLAGTIAPTIQSGRRVLITAHGNSLRALVKYLDGITDADIVGLNIPTGIPLVYELNEMLPIRHFYLGDAETARAAAERVAAQSKART